MRYFPRLIRGIPHENISFSVIESETAHNVRIKRIVYGNSYCPKQTAFSDQNLGVEKMPYGIKRNNMPSFSVGHVNLYRSFSTFGQQLSRRKRLFENSDFRKRVTIAFCYETRESKQRKYYNSVTRIFGDLWA